MRKSIALLAAALAACGAAVPSAQDDQDAKRYQQDQEDCIHRSPTIEASRACRAAVRADAGRP